MRIEKNPGLGFSISGGISGQGNPFKPSDKVNLLFLLMNKNAKKWLHVDEACFSVSLYRKEQLGKEGIENKFGYSIV